MGRQGKQKGGGSRIVETKAGRHFKRERMVHRLESQKRIFCRPRLSEIGRLAEWVSGCNRCCRHPSLLLLVLTVLAHSDGALQQPA